MLQDLPPDHDLTHLETALQYVQRFRFAVDGGAHRGIWTRVLAQRFEHVLAFEPHAENAAHVPAERTTLIHAALGEAPGRASMAPGEDNTGEWHLTAGDEVDVLALDAFALTVCDFLKLDVEGYELFALRGAAETLKRCRPVVLIEEKWHCERYGIAPGAAPAFLIELGMREIARCNKDHVFIWG